VATSGRADHGDLEIGVTVTITNTGRRVGREVVQVYVGDPQATIRRPPRELKAFAKVTLEPGASQKVHFALGWRDLAFWSVSAHRWRIEEGRFELEVGASSRDIRLRASVEVAGDGFRPPLDAASTLEEWLDDPDGRAVLEETFGAGDRGLGALIRDDGGARMLGQFTLATIASFGMGVGGQGVDRLVAEAASRRG